MEPTTQSRWADLPSDGLTTLTILLDPLTTTLLLRSVCHSWRLSLPPPPPSPPLPLPSLNSHPLSISLLTLPLYLISPPSSSPFLLKPTNSSLLHPLSSSPLRRRFTLSLLTHPTTLLSHSYSLTPPSPLINKLVVSTQNDVVIILALTHHHSLLLLKPGHPHPHWTPILTPNNRRFNDITTFNGNFYATADNKGRLVLIDYRLTPLDLVPGLFFGSGECSHLVVCNNSLYLVDRVDNNDRVGGFGVELGVFKLDEKSRFWDYQLDLDGAVFFIGRDSNFAVSKKDLGSHGGGVGDCVYFVVGEDEGVEYHLVFDMKTGVFSSVVGNERFQSVFWPPNALAMDNECS